ncbi:MAG TPA: MFS transporter [Candidatus Scatomorpha intestinavium]|uniref:MFS transporter n=1 Tax=Candidatus Scatomorpha intestinavium TaxID=2840922 RepID=A0A9D0ZEB6_9FIRM|nr:MFS transporter [Candidatus Scatomorpha intestinavium]
MKNNLWTRDFTLITVATIMGAAGAIAGNFALSFLVYDETGSTLASALIIAINFVPGFVVPLVASPFMDALPRKPFLVAGDAVNGVLYLLMGLYLNSRGFTYTLYLLFSLLLSSLSAFDQLAYNSLFPKLIPPGCMDKGYAVSSMVYPVMQVVMAPVAALLMDLIGVGNILLLQGGLSIAAALTESRIRTEEERRAYRRFSLRGYFADLKEAADYLRQERGMLNIFAYMAVTNGVASGYAPIFVAFFSSTPGLSAAMYSLFAVAEFAGRTLGGVLRYATKMPKERRFGFAFAVYQVYETMDMLLLWLPYPLMLANRAIAGFLGINSATLRLAAVLSTLPDRLRARVNAFESVLYSAAFSVLSLAVGALGEVMDLRLCVTLCAFASLIICWMTIWRRRREIRAMYENAAE